MVSLVPHKQEFLVIRVVDSQILEHLGFLPRVLPEPFITAYLHYLLWVRESLVPLFANPHRPSAISPIQAVGDITYTVPSTISPIQPVGDITIRLVDNSTIRFPTRFLAQCDQPTRSIGYGRHPGLNGRRDSRVLASNRQHWASTRFSAGHRRAVGST